LLRRGDAEVSRHVQQGRLIVLPFSAPLLFGSAAAGATAWRIRDIVDQGGGFLGASEVKFLKTVGDAAQPGAGVASGSAAVSGSAAGAFDSDVNTDFVATFAADGSTFLRYDFTQAWDIAELLYRNRGFANTQDQAPRHLVVEKLVGGIWVTVADICGIPFWGQGETRRFPVVPLVDDVGANAHRYWRLVPLTNFGDGSCVEAEVELFDANDINVAPNFNKWLGPVPYSMAAPATNGVKTGFGDFINFTGGSPWLAMGLDFFKKRDIRKVALTSRSITMTQSIRTSRVEYSDDGVTWFTKATIGVVSPWTIFAGVTISGGILTASNATNICQQTPVLTVGQTYNFSFNYNKTGGSKLRIEDGSGFPYISGVLSNGAGTLSGSFVACGTTFRIGADTASYSGTIDDIVINQGGGPNLIADGTFSTVPDPVPTANQTRTFIL
jgi:hypothetical protein